MINNGWVTNAFKIERGIRQGCPLSALLFVFIVVEVMASRVRSNMNIKLQGISIPIREEPYSYDILISQLADDATLFVDSVESGNNAMQEVLMFGEYAGLQLNRGRNKNITLKF